jgi:hypothetical protein|tara:strand:+ start:1175 stop:2197 length:1023 start_codon:yes stop_codon:yes gene_type:complete
MSKYLRIGNGDYNISVKEGGEITLDTTDGALNGTGKVIITGDLEVKGDTSTINSTVVTVADNIIVLSKDNIAAGIPAALNYRSGIEIERGSVSNAFMIYDEQLAWTLGGTSGTGTWTFEQGTTTVPIKATGMFSDANLYLNPGTGVLSVTNTTNYEQRVFTYSGSVVTDGGSGVVIDDDIIPNTKALVDYVVYALSTGSVPARLQESDTSVEAHDFSVTGTESNIQLDINGVATANLFANRFEVFDLKLQDNEISTTSSNVDLILGSPGTGSVKIKDTLELTETPGEDDVATDPTAPGEGIKLYSKTMSNGGTGLFFINKSNRQDELISKRKALVFSMVF